MKLILVFIVISLAFIGETEKYFTKKGQITFFSKTALEDIEATNNRVTSVIEPATGKIEFAVLITAFEFDKALMQEHFNENYMESDKYPKANFQGIIDNYKEINFQKDGIYEVTVSGSLTMHGVTNQISEKGKIRVKSGIVSAECAFKVALKEYNIKIPKAVGNKLAEVIDVKINITKYEYLKK